jgi:hypothetical protein
MDADTRGFVRQRANNRCEYCLLQQKYCPLTHHIEHIIARQHSGHDGIENLALACHRCNLRKGPNLTGVDPETSTVVSLFHPRRDEWSEHFLFLGVRIEGRSPVGRVTVHVLAMNDAGRLELRSELLASDDLR